MRSAFVSKLNMDPAIKSESISNEYKAIRYKESWRRTLILSFQSLGIVFSRLSTAPLYVFGSLQQQDIHSKTEIYELVSFIFWTLTIIPLVKYALIVLGADNDGEGGTLSLYSLLCRHARVGLLPNDKSTSEILQHTRERPMSIPQLKARKALERHKSGHYLLLLLALLGCCLIISDGILTPSVSVLSATSGLERSLIKLSHRITKSESRREDADRIISKIPVPSACIILICLFTMQHHGTEKIAIIFSPVVTLWLLFVTGIGLYNIVENRDILNALSPVYMFRFIQRTSLRSWKMLGVVIVCTAGSEEMFASLGHFSKKSIKLTFLCVVYPALVLCYAGQAAFISKNFGTSPDFLHIDESVPSKDLHHVFAVLSVFASAVGSQATISASFSIINQCQALSCFPRVKVVHTSNKIRGQVYVPDVNWLFMFLCLGVTLGFHHVSSIGNAVGLAVVLGMLVTTCLMSLVIIFCWGKSFMVAACFLVLFGSVEIAYLSSSVLSFPKGGWFLAILLFCFLTTMVVWHYGTLKKYEFDIENKVSLDWLTDYGPGLGISRVHGIGFIYTDIVSGIPAFFSHFISVLPAFHQLLIFVSFKSLPVPYVPQSQRYLLGRLGPKEYRIFRCVVLYGYHDRVRDTDDFEDHIISSLGEFIANEEEDRHDSFISQEGKMMVVGRSLEDASALITLSVNESGVDPPAIEDSRHEKSLLGDSAESSNAPVKRKKVRFVLAPDTPIMSSSIRQELQELVDARESGTAYFLGKSHLSTRNNSNFLKELLVALYVFLDKNSREAPVVLNIPQSALLEVGMVYTI